LLGSFLDAPRSCGLLSAATSKRTNRSPFKQKRNPQRIAYAPARDADTMTADLCAA
jgi:hypothetical protein